MTVQPEQLQVLLKAYETCQSLAKSNAESSWSVRSWGIGIWSALIAYSFKEKASEITLVALAVLVCVFVVEMAIRQIQYAFIKRALAIEDSLNDVLVAGTLHLPPTGVSTNIETPTVADLIELLRIKRWLLWFPYLLLCGFTIIALKMM